MENWMMWQFVVVGAMLIGYIAACPDSCYCHHDQGLLMADCSSLPTISNKIESLTLNRLSDDLLVLTDGQFTVTRHLKYLILRNSSIFYIHKKAFYGAKSIIEIDLSYNYLEKLEPTVFQHLTSLSSLSLRGNLIHFTAEVPFLISNSLQHLDVGQCKLRSIPRGVFYGLKRLRYLSLDGNFLKTLKYNSLPKGLKHLNLSDNLIVNMPTEVLYALTNIRKIGLGGNPINCSCTLMNLQDWLSGRGVIIEGNVTCALPPEYYGLRWSQVDEKRLCLAEVRREEQESYSTIYHPLNKSKLYREHYLENDNSYLGESVQADQPSFNTEAEVLFQNDETAAMGDMMRNKEEINEENEKAEININEHLESEKDIESATIGKDAVEVIPEEVSKPEQLENADKAEIIESEFDVEKDETILNLDSGEARVLQNGSLETLNSNLEKTENSEELNENSEKTEPSLFKEFDEDIAGSGAGVLELDSLRPGSPVSENSTVELITINEENAEMDDLKKEGFMHAENDRYIVPPVNNSDTLEESTVLPDVEETNKFAVSPINNNDTEESTVLPNVEEATKEMSTTEDSLPVNKEDGDSDLITENSTVTTTEFPVIFFESPLENTDGNQSEEKVANIGNDKTEIPLTKEETPLESTEIIQKSIVTDLSNSPTNNNSKLKDNIIESNSEDEQPGTPKSDEKNKFLVVPPSDGAQTKQDEKFKEVASAEVVMFCVGVLVICLLLFSVYKCRTRRKGSNNRTIVDLESSKGTELQDMASLLPKPQEQDKKNNLKYPDKATSGENIKLLMEQNDNESHKFTAVSEANHKIEDNNLINNNTSNNTNKKTPLINAESTAPTNPASPTPIQRTKAKVGIIPDSIPRTPILIQKSYNGTTKKV